MAKETMKARGDNLFYSNKKLSITIASKIQALRDNLTSFYLFWMGVFLDQNERS